MDIMDYIEIQPFPHELIDKNLTRKCCIKRINNNTQVDSADLWFKFDRSIESPSADDCDSHLLAISMYAMNEKWKYYSNYFSKKFIIYTV